MVHLVCFYWDSFAKMPSPVYFLCMLFMDSCEAFLSSSVHCMNLRAETYSSSAILLNSFRLSLRWAICSAVGASAGSKIPFCRARVSEQITII